MASFLGAFTGHAFASSAMESEILAILEAVRIARSNCWPNLCENS